MSNRGGGGPKFSMDKIAGAIAKAAVQSAKQSTASKAGKQQSKGRNNRGNPQRQALAMGALLRSLPKTIAPKEQRIPQALTNLYMAPRGHGYYDSFVMNPDSAILSSAVGPVTTVQGTARALITGNERIVAGISSVNPGTTEYAVPECSSAMIMFNPGSSDDVVGYILRPQVVTGSIDSTTGTGRQYVQRTPITLMQFAQSDGFGPTAVSQYYAAPAIDAPDIATTDHPVDFGRPTMRTESIPLRGSIRIRNITENFNVGGVVRVLRYNGGLNLAPDAHVGPAEVLSDGHPPSNGPYVLDPNVGQWDPSAQMLASTYHTVAEMVRNAKRTRHYIGKELQESHQANT